MRDIDAGQITQAVRDLFLKAPFELGADVMAAFEQGLAAEESPVGREVLKRLIENAQVARTERIPLCQDTGLAILFVDLGQDVHVSGAPLSTAIEEGVRQAYRDAYLRKSVCHPLTRANTGDNTPVVIHYDIVPGDGLRIMAVPKGGGCENMSRVFMLKPADGWAGIREKVLWSVSEAGPNPCPPITVGVAVGATLERAAQEAKKQVMRHLGSANPDPEAARLEAELYTAVNNLGIGPMGLGGRITCLGVHLKLMPCHIASLPVAVKIQCHSSRHAEAVL
jgi:fumarate hydratase subunit alpha